MITNIIPKPQGPFSLQEISEETNCRIQKKNINVIIHNIKTLSSAKKGDLSFLDNMRYLKDITNCKASAIIVPSKLKNELDTKAVILKSDNAYASFAKAMQKFYPLRDNERSSKNLKTKITIHADSKVSENSYIEKNVHVMEGTEIKHFSTIGPNVIIGRNCFIGSNVNISNTIIGDCTVINSGTVIGGDGFGFAPIDGQFIKVPQIGIVIIGDNVEVGSNCTIDKGSINHTEIKNGVKIDNLVHIAHNVIINENTAIAGQTGIAGSTTIGKNVMIGGQVGIAGHLSIGNNVKIGAQAGVTKNIKDNVSVSGTPAVKLSSYLKKTVMLNKMVNSNE